MIEEVAISGLGVIEDTVVEFSPGLTVVSGETGAGKTIVVTALGLLLGARADASAVRIGAKRSRIDGRILVEPGSRAFERAADAGAELDDKTLILSRSVGNDGRSRAWAGGAAVPASVLASIASDLIAIHGQAGQHQLLSPQVQRHCLDAFGGAQLLECRGRVRALFDERRAVSAELAELTGRARERAQEADLLRLGLEEIASVDPTPGEDDALRAQARRLGHVDGLRRAADEARMSLSGDDASVDAYDALAMVARARKSLEAERSNDGRLDELADQLAAASYALADTAADLAAYADQLETDPIRLGVVQQRLAVLAALRPRYGETIDDILDWSARAARRLDELTDDSARIERLHSNMTHLSTALDAEGRELSRHRSVAAHRLEQAVTSELNGLAMPQTRFVVEVTGRADASRDGFDDVGFMILTDADGQPRPIQRSASGGELSRIMLAIEVCLAATSPVPTMVFDEVDAGVGGKAAVEVGRRLARLARSVQVVVVTHLPQVAAFADRHYLVEKTTSGGVTTSDVSMLDELGRRRELSRMLAGLENSDTALAHADELVAIASAERAEGAVKGSSGRRPVDQRAEGPIETDRTAVPLMQPET